MADEIVRVIVKDAPVKAMAITGREMAERARQIHKSLPVGTAALGLRHDGGPAEGGGGFGDPSL